MFKLSRSGVVRFAGVCIVAALLAICGAGFIAYAKENATKPYAMPVNPNGDLIWGANGHPTTAYGSVTLDEQMAALARLGLTYYRVGARLDMMDAMLAAAKKHGITLLPVVTGEFDLEKDTPEQIYQKTYGAAKETAKRYRGKIKVWELHNELEVHAIILPCEMRDDGTQYPCEWGPAGGVGPGEYYGPRWKKVSAALHGLSDGIAAGDPKALRAIGAAGWGHTGMFERLEADGVKWDISVWHVYRLGGDEWAYEKLAKFKKPIWITEFNHPFGSTNSETEQANGLAAMMKEMRKMRRYGVEAAFVYELLDEPYWTNFEGKMGLIRLIKNQRGEWVLSSDKPAAEAVQSTIESWDGSTQ
ncbi:MAG: glycosyl hydrolase [Caulobacterales bacterium]